MEPGDWVKVQADSPAAFRDGHVGFVLSLFACESPSEPRLAWVRFPQTPVSVSRDVLPSMSAFYLHELIPTEERPSLDIQVRTGSGTDAELARSRSGPARRQRSRRSGDEVRGPMFAFD